MILARVLFVLLLVLLAGCERKAPDAQGTVTPATPATAAAPVVPSAGAKESSPANPAAADAAGMVRIAGGKFVMGDKDEVDAPLHEVVVSSFWMDTHLVTQEQFQKLMGANPSR